jgi:hypothetical protein
MMCRPTYLAVVPGAAAVLIAAALPAAVLIAAALPAAARIVAEPAMASHCAEAAATELGVMMNDVLTLPVERTSGKFHVYGQYPASGQDVTLFECQYDGNRNFIGISVQGHHGHHGAAASSGLLRDHHEGRGPAAQGRLHRFRRRLDRGLGRDELIARRVHRMFSSYRVIGPAPCPSTGQGRDRGVRHDRRARTGS